MGTAVDRSSFDAVEYERFARRLDDELEVLRALLARPDFGAGPESLGAELELSIVGADGRPLLLNRTLLREAADPNLALELDRFNVEYNLPPVPMRGRPFDALRAELDHAIRLLNRVAAPHGGRVVPIGILPTLRSEDLLPSAMTELPRYRALSNALRRRRGTPFEIAIAGAEQLSLTADEVTFEGANTSLQIHLRVPPSAFAATFNAAQLATPVVLAVSANSPTFLGRRLWDETRVALFQQSVDARPEEARTWAPPARVSFGQGWVREGAWELFAESVVLHPPLIPILSDEEPASALRAGRLPRLAELRLHQGTVWNWNRAIYDSAAGGHLRIEMRSLPAGPTPVDMAASAAFLVGLAAGLRPRLDRLLAGLPFRYARANFYEAARHGYGARLLWPDETTPSPREVSARDLALRLLPVAGEGLSALGVDDDEIRPLLDLLTARIASETNGARWQRRMLDRLDRQGPRDEALVRLLDAYLRESASGAPVHEWREDA